MRNPVNCLLLVFFLNAFASVAQEPAGIPTGIPWHTWGGLERIQFSHDGRYLFTHGNDDRLIISDLKARSPFFAVENVDRFVVSEKENFFCVLKSSSFGEYTVQKISTESGQVISEFEVHPTDGYRVKDPDIIALDETTTPSLLIPCTNGVDMVISVFGESGNVLKSYGPLKNERVNAILPSRSLLVLTSRGVYEVENEKIQSRVPASPNTSFANMKLKSDTLFVLGNRAIHVYKVSTWKKIREIATPFFASGEADLSRASMLTVGHPFEIDDSGNCWMADTRIASSFDTGTKSREKRRYLMAKIHDHVEYPLVTSIEAGRLPFESVGSAFALHPGKELVALTVNEREVIIYHQTFGELFRLNKNAVEFESVYFTNTPGRILLRHNFEDFGIFLDLTNGRQEHVYLLENRFYRKNRYHETGIKEKLFVPNESGFQTAAYVTGNNETFLTFEIKDRSIQDTVTLPLSKGTIKLSKIDGHLLWLDAQHKVIKKLLLKTPKGGPIVFNQHNFRRYSYDSTNALLAVSYNGESINNSFQYIIDLNTGKIKKELNESGALTLLENSTYYVNDQGFFDYKTGKKISAFPEAYIPYMVAYDFVDRQGMLKMVYSTMNDDLISFDLKTGKHIVIGREPGVEKIFCDPNSENFFTISDHGVKIWSTSHSEVVATITFLGNSKFKKLKEFTPSYTIQTPDGYFMGNNRYFDILALRKGTRQYSVQSMDQQFNRPDKVLKALGYADNSFVENLESVLSKRTQSAALSANDVSIKNKTDLSYYSSTGKINLSFDLVRPLSANEGIMVYVNGTALWQQPAKTFDAVKNLSIDVVDPVNYIRATVISGQSSESPGDYVIVNATTPAKRNLYVVSIGISNYANPDNNLKYAAKDAKEINDNLRLTTSYENVKTIEFYDEKVDRNMLGSIRSFLKQTKPEDQVIAYYAGHGLLNERSEYYLTTYNIDMKKPEDDGILLGAMLDAISGSPARKKLIVLDACNSGLVDDMQIPSDNISDDPIADSVTFQHRGVEVEVPVKPNYSTLYFTISTAAADNGVNIIAACAGNEAALEGGGLKNGLFTYSFIKALESGEANRDEDDAITVNELQSYIASQVQALTRGKQRPSYRQANIYYDAPIFTATDPIFWHFVETVKANNVNFAEQLLKDGKVNINQRDPATSFTPLHFSAREGNFKMTQLLLGYGADVNAKSDFGHTPAYLAAFNGHHRILYLLALSGGELESLKSQHNINAIKAKNNAAVLNIINNFESLKLYDIKVSEFMTALHDDVAKGEKLFTKDINLNHKSFDGYPLLFQAIAAKKFEAAKWLVDHKADVNLSTDDDLFTPLMLVAFLGNQEFLQYLLANGADKNKKDKLGRTALDYARQTGNIEVQRLLEK